MTHSELVNIAYRYCLKNCSVGVAFREFKSITSEIADVIGFGAWEHSVLIECKVSRSDFLSDKKKLFRKDPKLGMGKQRFYCCPEGLIKKEELPDGWGLIWVDEKRKARCVYSPYKGNIQERNSGFNERNLSAEMSILYSALRRLALRGRIEEIYQKLS